MRKPVVPRKGDVDRNWQSNTTMKEVSTVVPRKGDVDRNAFAVINDTSDMVVPRKGDVDRNIPTTWNNHQVKVVPRKGDVDRNENRGDKPGANGRRPPQGGRG